MMILSAIRSCCDPSAAASKLDLVPILAQRESSFRFTPLLVMENMVGLILTSLCTFDVDREADGVL